MRLSPTSLKRFKDSRHKWAMHYIDNTPDVYSEESPAMVLGSLVDCMLFSPDEVEARFYLMPDDAPKRPSVTQRNAAKPSATTVAAIEFWDKVAELATDKTIVSKAVAEQAAQICDAVKAHKVASALIAKGTPQVKLEGNIGKHEFKGIADIVNNTKGWVCDMKVTAFAADADIVNRAIREMWHTQLAVYSDLSKCGECYMLLVSPTTPHIVRVIHMDKRLISVGRDLALKIANEATIFAKAWSAGDIASQVEIPDLPNWIKEVLIED